MEPPSRTAPRSSDRDVRCHQHKRAGRQKDSARSSRSRHRSGPCHRVRLSWRLPSEGGYAAPHRHPRAHRRPGPGDVRRAARCPRHGRRRTLGRRPHDPGHHPPGRRHPLPAPGAAARAAGRRHRRGAETRADGIPRRLAAAERRDGRLRPCLRRGHHADRGRPRRRPRHPDRARDPGQARQQERLRDLITDDPARAARDRQLGKRYKLPVFVNANIHGNEFEGTDAALRLVEDYATSEDPQVVDLLERSRIHLVVTMNPDGRHGNTRRNSAGFDLNRDFVTATQPETIAVRDALIATQPALMLDLHGYVNGTLVEPTTPPHGENYEYDLFIEHAYPNGLGMEEAINGLGYDADDGVEPVQVPLRDWDEGWDDWPPIFTPQYAALHGAVAHTIEVPLRVNNSSYDLPVEELERRSRINTDIAHAAVTATLEYAATHRDELLADHIEIFRRGEAGEPQTPVEEGLFDGVIGPEDVYTTTYPRAYVIPSATSSGRPRRPSGWSSTCSPTTSR
nr:M14 family zinc carboxypeptidase [Serinicoccus marinus]